MLLNPKLKRAAFAALTFIAAIAVAHTATAAEVKLRNIQGHVPITTWKQVRDERVILQIRDKSCAASATALTHCYGIPVTEDDVVAIAGKEAWLSMADLKQHA